jgi:hypothetical protein
MVQILQTIRHTHKNALKRLLLQLLMRRFTQNTLIIKAIYNGKQKTKVKTAFTRLAEEGVVLYQKLLDH